MRRRVSKQTTPPLEGPVRDALRQRLKNKKRLFAVARQGGTSQEVMSMMSKMNEADEEKLRMMQDAKEQVYGMSQKKAKKYLKKVVSTMNPDQVSEFKDMVKDKMPASERQSIMSAFDGVASVAATKATPEQKTAPQVYTPARLLNDEQRAAALAAQRAPAPVATDPVQTATTTTTTDEEQVVPKRRKKQFNAIDIRVPSLQELNKKPVIEELPEVIGLEQLTYKQRCAYIASFSASEMDQTLSQTLIMGECNDLVVVDRFEWYADPVELFAPDSNRNVSDECRGHKLMLKPVKRYLLTLLNRTVSLKWLKRWMHKCGIITKDQDVYNLLCGEYSTDKTSTYSAMIPYFKMHTHTPGNK